MAFVFYFLLHARVVLATPSARPSPPVTVLSGGLVKCASHEKP